LVIFETTAKRILDFGHTEVVRGLLSMVSLKWSYLASRAAPADRSELTRLLPN